MSQLKLTDANGKVLYFYQSAEEGLKFEAAFDTPGNTDGDVEIIFTVPPTEYFKIYEKYELDASNPIEKAVSRISDLGRGAELATDLAENIERIDQFTWVTFDD